MKRVKLLFAWYDIWVGFYWDRKEKVLYFFPVPMLGLMIDTSDFLCWFGKHDYQRICTDADRCPVFQCSRCGRWYKVLPETEKF